MKKATWFLLLCVSFGYAQDLAVTSEDEVLTAHIAATPDKLLTNQDFKRADGRMLVENFEYVIHNGSDSNTILVSVVCLQEAFNEIGIDKINEMIRIANDKVRNSLKTEHHYDPKEIKMAYLPDSQDWSLTNSFSEQDANGIVKNRLLSIDFDGDGEFSKMMRIM